MSVREHAQRQPNDAEARDDAAVRSTRAPGEAPRLLLVTRDADIGPVLLGPLRTEGYEVNLVGDGRSALEFVRREPPPSLVIVDLDLPDMRGADLFRELRGDRTTRSVPLLVVTHRDSEADRVIAFELGADDFVGAPFSTRELLLRVRVLLRSRTRRSIGSTTLEVGSLRLDGEAHRVWVGEKEVTLSVREFRLLQTLMERSERVLSRPALLDLVWGATANVGMRAVDAYITRLRRKLGDARDYVETVSSVGYRLKRPA